MAKTLEDKAKGLKKGVESAVTSTEKLADSANKGFEAITGRKSVILGNLTNAGSSAMATGVENVINAGTAAATTATSGNQLLTSVIAGDLGGITDAMAKGATSVNDLLTQLSTVAPAIPNVQLPVQITASIGRLKNGKDIYDAANAVLTALVTDAAGGMGLDSVAALTTHFNQNWDTFSAKIDALFQVAPDNGQQAVLETIAKSMFGTNVYNAASVVKRQVPGVLSGIVGVKDAINQFGGSYRDPIEAATKIRSGVEKMVQAIEKISQSLNEMVKYYQGRGIPANGQGFPLLDSLGSISGTQGIKVLDTALRIGGGAAAVAGHAGALAQAIKNKDVKGAIAAAKKAFDDFKKLTKKGKYNAQSLTTGSSQQSPNAANQNSSTGQSEQSKNSQSMAGSSQLNSYVCSGATMKCTMGSSTAKLTVLPSRTVFLTGQPMANISDHLTMINLAPFGRCRSLGFPATASATAAHHGHLTPMPCMHNTPFPWMNGKNDYIVKGDPALLKTSTCQCMWGGTISIINDGQFDQGAPDMSREKLVEFDRNQPHAKVKTVNTLKHDQHKQRHVKRVIKKMEQLNTNKAYFFWTNGGGEYASELRAEIMNSQSGKDLVVEKLEESERGKIMEQRANKIMSLLSGKDVDKMSWEEKSVIYNSLKDDETTRKHIDRINKYQSLKSGQYAKDAASSKKNENAAIFLVVGTRHNEDNRIAISPDSIWRSKEKMILLEEGLGIDGLLLNGDI